MDFSGKKIYIETYGCQQNEADSETVAGIALNMGFSLAAAPEEADLVIVNTCAVREHAELKALSNTGRLKHLKAANPDLKIGVCGCMVQQESRKDDLKNKYPYVDFVFGTNMFEKLSGIIETVFSKKGRVMKIESYDINPGTVCEGLPVKRKYPYKAYLPIMSGCNNFCTYCIVPYVRGRERSKDPGFVVEEAKKLINSGCREITLLGQNVNSFGKDLGIEDGFAELLGKINAIEGDFIIRFMTSHPKDVSPKLIEAMGSLKKCAPHFHLPLQSGSDRILKLMN
ncbi:MAG: MiaB/RimO family radical SAM methylthiotransferase, partial [Clostridia bacterium]|nr:MiaB/RimO family radical SAM methylthiotransferase [Clostridia bacterium]